MRSLSKKISQLLITNLFLVIFAPAVQLTAASQVLFSPFDKPTNHLIASIKQAKKSIHVAVYMLTDKRIAQALIDAHTKRNIEVKILTDEASTGRYGKADMLTQAGLDVYVLDPKASFKKTPETPILEKNTSETKNVITRSEDDRWYSAAPIMHHKFAIIDGNLLWTGSFNWTNAANRKNHENVLITHSRETCRAYKKHFNFLWSSDCFKKHTVQRADQKPATSLGQAVAQAAAHAHNESDLAATLQNLLENYHATKNMRIKS